MRKQTSFFNLLDYFLGDHRLDEFGSRIAIRFRGEDFTYTRLREEVDYWRSQIASRGIGEGDRVAMLVYDSPEFIAGFLATVSLGAISVPINTFLPAAEVQFILKDSGARLLLIEQSLSPQLDIKESEDLQVIFIDDDRRPGIITKKIGKTELAETSTDGSTPAFILYTSGSTGNPKGALHLHENIAHTVAGFGDQVLKLTGEDVVFSASRLFFAYGLGNSLSFPLHSGATVILETDRPTPEKLRNIFIQQRPTVFYAVPAVYQALLNHHRSGTKIDISSLRLCISAGEALPVAVFEDWRREFGHAILDGIGSTEMLHMFISNQEGSARAGSSGTVVPGYEAKLVDDAGSELNGAGTGNLLIRGRSAMRGYWNRNDLTDLVLSQGWVRTGDVYRREEDDFFYHVGRSDDCFKVKGLWISPVEVEAALLEHKAVSEAAVVAGSDEIGLATVKAYVVIRTEGERELLKQELLEFARMKLAPYKAPTEIEFIAEMPRTSTGKIQRYKLRG